MNIVHKILKTGNILIVNGVEVEPWQIVSWANKFAGHSDDNSRKYRRIVNTIFIDPEYKLEIKRGDD